MKQKPRSATVFILDLLILYACFLGVFVQYVGSVTLPLQGGILMLFVAVVWFIIAVNSSIVTININFGVFTVLKDTFIGYSILSVSVVGIVATFGEFAPNNKLILWPLLFGLLLSCSFRVIFLVCGKYLVKKGYQQKQIILVGDGRMAKNVIEQLLASPNLGYKLYGVVAGSYHEALPKNFYLGKIERLSEIIRSGMVDEVIIALPFRLEKIIIQTVEMCEIEGIRVRIVPDFFRIIRNWAMLERLGNIPLIGVRTEPLSLLKNRVLKRMFDIGFSLFVLVLLLPSFLVLALLIKLTSPGHAFFKQERVGINNAKFDIYKFRSMKVQDKKESDSVWTTEGDSRVTMIGKFIRRHNIDELPQFWNVLAGNMSIVGPRPEREHFVEQFKNNTPHYKSRHLVKSGITGWAQVNGWRGNTSIKKRVACDIYYIENWTFGLDMKIIWLTLFGRKTQKNAY